MIEFNWIHEIAPIIVALVSFILIYASLIKLKIPGNNFILALLSALITLILVSSTGMIEFIVTMIPWFTVIMIIIFLTLLVLTFATNSIGTFGKILAWTGFIAVILIVLCSAFDSFPTFYHLLPNTSDAYLNSSLRGFKDWIYSNRIINSIVLIISMIIVGFFVTKN